MGVTQTGVKAALHTCSQNLLHHYTETNSRRPVASL